MSFQNRQSPEDIQRDIERLQAEQERAQKEISQRQAQLDAARVKLREAASAQTCRFCRKRPGIYFESRWNGFVARYEAAGMSCEQCKQRGIIELH